MIVDGECLDDVDLLRADQAQTALRGHGLPEPATLGRFLRRFTLGDLGQLLRRPRPALRARPSSACPRPVTRDLGSTLIEHHGPVGSRHDTRETYTGKVAWHRLLAFIGETGEWAARAGGAGRARLLGLDANGAGRAHA